MLQITDLLTLFDFYRWWCAIERETTLSYRVFGDTKKVRMLRKNGDLTTTRLRGSFEWFSRNWPPDADKPQELLAFEEWRELSSPAPTTA